MGNIFTDFGKRISIDYTEYRSFLTSYWDVKRDTRLVKRAVKRAKRKNAADGRTYYILKDKTGGINEFCKSDIHFWTHRHKPALLPEMDFMQRLSASYAIVTSNEAILDQYNQVQLKKEQ